MEELNEIVETTEEVTTEIVETNDENIEEVTNDETIEEVVIETEESEVIGVVSDESNI